MSTTGGGDRRRSRALLAISTALFCAVVTALVVWSPFLAFAYRAPALHVVLETTNALISLLVAYLLYGRFRQDRRRRDLLLASGLTTLAVANLVLTAVPTALTAGSAGEPSRWTGVVIRLLGTALVAAAALTPADRRVPHRGARLSTAALVVLVLGLAATGTALSDRLPATVRDGAVLGDATRPALVAHPAVLVVQAAGALLFAVAAGAFTRQAVRTPDAMLRWLGAGCALGATAAVHYLLFPSLYSDLVYTGDVLRLGCYLFLLVGAAWEIRSYWALQVDAAVLEDRRRMARELHDGLTQELSYIKAQSRRLAAQPGQPGVAERIEAAAARASDEARRALAALTRPIGTTFAEALQHLAEELGDRYDVKVVAHLDPTVEPSQEAGESLLRIVGEAVRNAVRHGRAEQIDVILMSAPVQLAIADDGCGFDPGSSRRKGGFGLTSMRERAAALGGELTISSSPGEGTTVQVTLP